MLTLRRHSDLRRGVRNAIELLHQKTASPRPNVSLTRGSTMWMLKGVGLGLLVFAAFFLVYFSVVIAGGLRQNVALGVSAITGSTIYKPLFWLAAH